MSAGSSLLVLKMSRDFLFSWRIFLISVNIDALISVFSPLFFYLVLILSHVLDMSVSVGF